MNSRGVPFPILGVCQGNELLAFISNNGSDLLISCEASKVNLPLKFKPDFRNSSLYSMAEPKDVRILATLPVTANHHK
jgi:gamma-glutamyl hydrolase